VKSVHQMRFQSRLSGLVSLETSNPIHTSCACLSLERRSLQLYSSRKRFWSHLAQRQSRPLEDFQAHSGAYLRGKLSAEFKTRNHSRYEHHIERAERAAVSSLGR
jgi:hypothetical protein